MRAAITSGVILAAGLVLCACAVGPRYRTPPVPPTAGVPFVSATAAAAANQPPPPTWWRLYRDPVLDRLVLQALAENEDLKVAAANLAYAQGLLDEARAGRFPATNLSGGVGYGRSTQQASSGQPANWTYGGAFTASYDIDLFGRIRRSIDAASANAGSVQATEDAVRVTVAGETASAYADVCGFGHQLAVARQSLDLVQKTYDITKVETGAGALSDFDLAREAVLLHQARAAIPPLEGQRRVALFTLAALIGKTPAEAPADAAACVTPPTLTQPLPVGDGAALLRRRPDLREAERALAAATARIGVATADLYPTVTLGGSVNPFGPLSGPGSPATFLAYSLGPLITWTFPNILVARAHVKETSAQASAALATFDGTVLTALKEAEQALATYAEELDHHTALIAAREAADRAVALEKVQERAGSASFLDLLQVQATAIAADQAVAVSEQALSTDQVAVFQALGGGWEGAPPVTAPPIPKR